MLDAQFQKDKPNLSVSERVKKRILTSLRRSGRQLKMFTTNSYENSLLDSVTLPEHINVSFEDIGGLKKHKQAIVETLLFPLRNPQLFDPKNPKSASRLCAPPQGILFYGPPGTGKTMMAKAIAGSAGATFF